MSARAGFTLQSMTGFGLAEGDLQHCVWRWELRSVNGKGLDVKFRLPPGTEAMEPDLRQKLRVLHRGTINVSLRLERDANADLLRVDESALAAAAAALNKVRQYIDCDRPRPEAVLNMRGVIATPDDKGLDDYQRGAIVAGFDTAIAALLEARQTEGGRIVAVLKERCNDINAKVISLRTKTADTREQLVARIKAQISDLMADSVAEDRIAQEAAMLAIRADVSEELDRLDVHTKAFRDLLDTDGSVGRRLEFLTQELMREASTLTAKLHSAELKSEGLDLKELVDGLREQVLNLA
ncbi:MAG: YicC/YloC family endoribonuclease [Pseudomonadota bacterium]